VIQRLDQAWLWLLKALVAVAGLVIGAGVVLVVVDVTLRASGVRPPGFTVAFVEYSLLYMTLLAAPYLVRTKRHVMVDFLVKGAAPPLRRALETAVYLICLTVACVFAYFGWVLLDEAIRFGFVDERSVDIPFWLLYMLLPGSFGLVALEFLRLLFGPDTLYDAERAADSV
jgi:TRAP-type C4-dicarboxylate transport system permease small subunit